MSLMARPQFFSPSSLGREESVLPPLPPVHRATTTTTNPIFFLSPNPCEVQSSIPERLAAATRWLSAIGSLERWRDLTHRFVP